MKSFTVAVYALGAARLGAAQWWFGDSPDCAKACSQYRNLSPTQLCDSDPAASCASSACASASPTDYSDYTSATSAVCSVYSSCGDDITQTVTATREGRTAEATVTGCPQDNGWGWGGWGGSWGWSGDGDDDDDDDDNDWDDNDDDDDNGGDGWCRNGWACQTAYSPTTITVPAPSASASASSVMVTRVETQTVLQAVSGSVTQDTTLVVANEAVETAPAATTTQGSGGVAVSRRFGAAGAALVIAVAVAGVL